MLSLFMFGLLELALEVIGFSLAHGFAKGDLALAAAGSELLDVIKAIFAINGLVCAACISSTFINQYKSVILLYLSISEIIISLVSIGFAAYILNLLNSGSAPYILPFLEMTIFFIYALLKLVTFFGFCESLKAYFEQKSESSNMMFARPYTYIPLTNSALPPYGQYFQPNTI